MKVRSPQVLLIVCVGLSGCVLTPHPTRAAWPIDEDRVIDLTHPFNEHSIYWPTARPFELTEVSRGRNQAGRWYATNDFRA